MRIWHLPYEYLDNTRLNAQHREIHCLYSCLKNGTDWAGLVKQMKQHKGYFKSIHTRCLEEQSKRQGVSDLLDHKSPLIEELFDNLQDNIFDITNDILIKDITHLRNKWECELYHFGVGRTNLAIIEKQLLGRSNREDVLSYNEVLKDFKGKYLSQIKPLKGRMQDKVKTFFLLNPEIKDNLNILLTKNTGIGLPY